MGDFSRWALFCFILCIKLVSSNFFSLNDVVSSLYQFADYERCDSVWLLNNVSALQEDLEKKLYGQPLVKTVVLSALRGHFETNSSTPLTLSFHGSTGVGKTYVTELIVKNLYKKGLGSKFVHTYVASMHFPVVKEIESYEKEISMAIRSSVLACPQSLFIFDEVHRLQPGLLNKISSLIRDSRLNMDNKLSKSIFIFLSNTGQDVISNKTLEYINNGIDRDQFKLSDFESYLMGLAYHEGGLKHSELIKNSLVDHFVPFLPLEIKHVKKCIMAELIKLKKEDMYSSTLAQSVIIEAVTFWPESDKIFSFTGCKRISQKLSLLLYKAEFSENKFYTNELTHEDL